MSFLFSCFACVVFAQAAASPPASATAAKESYVSPFADYRRFDAESPPKPWRQANDEVREAGGHVGILKGMSGPAAATAAGKSPAGGASSAAPTPKGLDAEPGGKSPPPPQAAPQGEPKKAAGHSHGSHR
jgi:hypothetical protein